MFLWAGSGQTPVGLTRLHLAVEGKSGSAVPNEELIQLLIGRVQKIMETISEVTNQDGLVQSRHMKRKNFVVDVIARVMKE